LPCFGEFALALGSKESSEIFLNDKVLAGLIWSKLKIKGISRFKEISAGGMYRLQG